MRVIVRPGGCENMDDVRALAARIIFMLQQDRPAREYMHSEEREEEIVIVF